MAVFAAGKLMRRVSTMRMRSNNEEIRSRSIRKSRVVRESVAMWKRAAVHADGQLPSSVKQSKWYREYTKSKLRKVEHNFCAAFWHRIKYQHDVIELFYVNNRWFTRRHRVVVLLARLNLKFAVSGMFFLFSKSFGNFF